MLQVSETHLHEAVAKKDEGNKYFVEKDYDKAIECYTQAVEINPNEAVYYSNRAACYLALKQYKKTLDDCEQALKLDPTNAKSLRRKGLALMALGRLEEAVNTLKGALQITPNDGGLRTECNNAEQTLNNYREALTKVQSNDFQKALYLMSQVTQQSNCLEMQIVYIECMAKVGETDRASKWLMQLQSEHGSTPDVYYLKSIIDLYNGNSERAKKILLDGMRIDPDNKKCRELLKLVRRCEELKDKGNQLLQGLKYQEAYECYNEALQVDPFNKRLNSIIYANRGLVKQRQGEHDNAIEDFTKSLDLNPYYYKALIRRADSYDKLGKFEDSGNDYKKVAEIEPSMEQEMSNKYREAMRKDKLSKKKDYYKILEVARDATESEIKKSYRRLALLWHPDKQKDKDEETKVLAQQKFRDIAEAYSVLSDRKKRDMWDQGIDPNDQNGGGGGVDPSQVFSMFFGGGGGFQQFPGGGGVRFQFG